MKNLLLFLALASSSFIAVAQNSIPLVSAVAPADLNRPVELEEYELVTLDLDRFKSFAEVPSGEALRFSLQSPLGSKSFSLNRFEQRSNDYAASFRDASDRKPSAQWAGPGANFTIDENFVLGRWQEAGEAVHLEPLWLQVPDAPRNLYVIYRESDLIATDSRSCMLVEAEHTAPPEDGKVSEGKMMGCLTVEIALAADLFLYQALNNNATSVENFMLGVLADVQTDYDDAFADELRYEVTGTYIATSASTDPWSNTTDPASQSPPNSQNFVGILPEFTEWGNDNGFSGAEYDVATLWTGRDLDGSTVGIAWTPGACSSIRYNVCERFSGSATSLRVLWSHELGHNWNANHDGSNGFIMSPSVNATNTWSQNSINSIESYYGNSDCLTSCAVAPVASAMTLYNKVFTGSKIPFEDLTTGSVETRTWSFPGGVPATSNLRFPVVTYPTPGSYVASLTVTGLGTSSSASVNVDVASEFGRVKLLSYNNFEESFGELTIENPDNANTWVAINTSGNSGSVALGIDNYNNNFPGQIDRLQLPVQDFSSLSLPVLEFEYAYRPFDAISIDELRVRVSTDGTNFTEVYRGRQGESQPFSTGPIERNSFIPRTADDWCSTAPECIEINLSDYIGAPNVYIEIENLNDYGNNIWVDNIVLSSIVNAVLPVEWLAFNARANGKNASLDWAVEQTEDNAGFHIERTGATDNNWQTIGWVPAETDQATASYTYTDQSVSPGQTYLYRLRQTDNDGRESFSAIREVRFGSLSTSSLFPNPAKLETRLQTSFEEGAYELHNAAGQKILSGRVAGGTATLEIEALPAGLYFLRLNGDGAETEVLRLMKQ